MRNKYPISRIPSDPDSKAIQRSHLKAIVSGNFIQLYKYETSYIYNTPPLKVNRSYAKKKNTERRRDSVNRARQSVFHLVEANTVGLKYKPVFLTITFRDNIQDIRVANQEFTKFIKRLNYLVFDEKQARLKYLSVIEFQKRGAIHFHTLLFNMPFFPIKEIQKTWSHGNIDIKAIEDVKRVGAYVAKYITKETFDDKLYGEKIYTCSQGLRRPVVIKNEDKCIEIIKKLKQINFSYEAHFRSYINGNAITRHYDISEYLHLQKEMIELVNKGL